MWKTGGPKTSEVATPERGQTSHPKYSDSIRFLVNGGQTWIINKKLIILVITDASNKKEVKIVPVVGRYFVPDAGMKVKLLEF